MRWDTFLGFMSEMLLRLGTLQDRLGACLDVTIDNTICPKNGLEILLAKTGLCEAVGKVPGGWKSYQPKKRIIWMNRVCVAIE